MRSWGFINNRIFDALACGLPVVSDYIEGLEDLFPDDVPLYENKKQFFSIVDRMLNEHRLFTKKCVSLSNTIQNDFSFQSRALFIYEFISKSLKHKTHMNISLENTRTEFSKVTHTSKPIASIRELNKTIKRIDTIKNWLCPLCRTTTAKNSKYIEKEYKSFECPTCGSNEDQRASWLVIMSQLSLLFHYRRATILHYNPDPLIHQSFNNCDSISYITASRDSPTTTINAKLEALEFPVSSVHSILIDSIEPSYIDYNVFLVMQKLLKPGGFVLLDLPTENHEEADELGKQLQKNELEFTYQLFETRYSFNKSILNSLGTGNKKYMVIQKEETSIHRLLRTRAIQKMKVIGYALYNRVRK
jgi:hypothetical protein